MFLAEGANRIKDYIYCLVTSNEIWFLPPTSFGHFLPIVDPLLSNIFSKNLFVGYRMLRETSLYVMFLHVKPDMLVLCMYHFCICDSIVYACNWIYSPLPAASPH